MGEIKSTLEIIMEKSRGLTATEEEKETFRKKELEGKVRGFVRKYFDGMISMEQLKEETNRLGDDTQGPAKEMIMKECVERLGPEADNSSFLKVLEEVVGLDTRSLQDILSEFQEELEQKEEAYEQLLTKNLAELGISGTAVTPNLRADAKWRGVVSDLKRRFRERVEETL